MIRKVVKRDGSLQAFDKEMITRAIGKAFKATNTPDRGRAVKAAGKVTLLLEKKFGKTNPKVEEIQDTVEEVLLTQGFIEAAQAYIVYREQHRLLREKKGITQVLEPILSLNALKVLQRRYLLRDVEGNIIETPRQMLERAARAVARAEKPGKRKKLEKEFKKVLLNLEFLPNSPTLMNAGTRLGQLSACFVLPVEDSLESIFSAVKNMAEIQQTGGGTGFSFSRLRPRGDIVQSTKGIASGPVSFIEVFDKVTEVIKQGGKRRGANMGILSVEHPDVLEFIEAKKEEGLLKNFNVSVAVSGKFMKAAKEARDYPLVNPRTGQKTGKANARKVFDLVAECAWKTGDPGLVFLDRINKDNPTPELGRIEATNPCGEQPLLGFESCNLGSINLEKMVSQGRIDWARLRKTILLGVRFLDDVITVNKFSLRETEEITKANRKIGLGVMGFADFLIRLGIPYDSQEALSTAEKVMKFIRSESVKASEELAREKGAFPNQGKSRWAKKKKKPRNATLNTIAPTGTISIIAGTTSGIEPLFGVAYVREVMEGVRLVEVNPLFEEIARKRGFYSEKLMQRVARKGSIQDIKGIPRDVKRVFVTAFDIKPEWHVRMQAAFQKHTDNAVSKTVNLPIKSTVDDVKKIYSLAYALKCKGITVYRYGSKKEQVLYQGKTSKKEGKRLIVHSEYAGGCPTLYCPF